MKGNAMNITGSNMNTIKSNNMALILNNIRKSSVSRAELVKITGLKKSSVTTITNKLIAQGIVCETGTTSVSARGRRPVILDIVGNYRFAAAVLLHRSKISIGITDLKCTVIDSITHNTAEFKTADEIINTVCDNLQMLIDRNKLPAEKIIGIGVGAPGPLDYRAGVILDPPNFEIMHNLPVAHLLEQRFGFPVFLENNAVLLGLTEYYYGCMNKYNHAMFVVVSHGIGSAVIENGAVFRGKNGFAGELGHISVNIDGQRCSCGNVGCLELYASLEALEKHFGFDSYKEITDRAYAGDTDALNILKYEANYLAAGIINAVNLFDLDAIVIHGEVNYRPEILLNEIQRLVNNRSFITKAHKVEIIPSTLRHDADLYSCSAVVLNNFFNQTLN